MGTHRIIQTVPAKSKGETMICYDTETEGRMAVNARLYCAMEEGNDTEYVFYDRESFREWIESKAPCIAYAHRGNVFDIFGVLTPEECYQARKVSAGTKIFELEFNGVKYRDSNHLFGLPLFKIAKSVGMEKGITPEKFLTGKPLTREDIDDQDVEYCMMDVRILIVALRKLKELWAEYMEVPPHTVGLPFTAASLAYKTWCKLSWPESWHWTDARKRVRPIATCPKRCNEIFRDAEAGGMVRLLGEALENPGQVISGGVISYDRNAMYPSEMYFQTFPDMKGIGFVGPTFQALRSQISREDRVCVADLTMTASDGAYLGLPNHDDQGKRDWNQTRFSGWLCEPEIRFALENGWSVDEVRNIMSAPAIRPFIPFVETIYQKRLEMQRNGDPSESLQKLILNSCFGRFAIKEKPARIDGVALEELENQEDYEELLQSGWLERDYYDGIKAEWPFVLDNRELTKTPSSQWFGFSSFILSHARVSLGQAIVAGGEHALYTDTDSLHLRVEGRERFESKMDIGDELGQWKLETPEPIPNSIYWEPKVYVQMDKDMNRTLVKHKGIKVYDSQGNLKPEAGDLTKTQTTETVLSLYDGFRRGLEPGTEFIVTKKSKRFHTEDS